MENTREKPVDLDVAALFHSVLFAYQKVLRDAAGDLPTQTVTSLCVPVVEAALGKVAPGLTETDNVETALSKLGKLLVASKHAERAYVTKEGVSFVMNIEGCPFAAHAHDVLRPKDVTCPWGIIAMAIAKKVGKRETKLHFSDFTPTGAKTLIEFSSEK